jgi:hypothetical protein
VIGKPPIAGVENPRDARQFGCGMERPGPPDLPRKKYDGFRAAENFSVGRGYAHYQEQIPGRQRQKCLHARVLQSRKAEAMLLEGAAEAAGERSADAAIAVEANPSAGGTASFHVSHF